MFIIRPIRRSVLFFCLMYVLGAYCVVAEPWNGSRMIGLFELFLDLYVVVLLLALLPRWLRISVQAVFSVVAYLVAAVDLVCYERAHTPLTPMLYTIFLQSNPQEAGEALATYLTPDLLVSRCTPLLLLLFLQILLCVSFKLRRRFLKGISTVLSRYSRLIGVLTGVVLTTAVCLSWENKHYIYHRILLQQNELETQAACDIDPPTRDYIPLYRVAFAVSEHLQNVQVVRRLDDMLDEISVDSCSADSSVIVLIIGESFNRSHASFFGYDKATTPCEQQWIGEGRMVPFTNAISPWNVTCESFQHVFSTFAYGHKGAWYDEPLFTQLFKTAGYNVSFLSNQYVLDRSHSFSSFGEDLFMNNERMSQSQFNHRNTTLHEYDGSLLDDYDSLQTLPAQPTPRELVIFHFKAMHFEFSARYPQSHEYFHSSDYARPELSDEQRKILSDYDNAIRYVDGVMSAIVQRFQDKEAIIIHVPDHGEQVFDHGLQSYGRTLGWTPEEIGPQFEIPLWFYATERYQQSHPQQWLRIRQMADTRYMTDALAHTLLRLGGIYSKSYDPRLDILDSAYDASRQRLIRGERDYDAIIGDDSGSSKQ